MITGLIIAPKERSRNYIAESENIGGARLCLLVVTIDTKQNKFRSKEIQIEEENYLYKLLSPHAGHSLWAFNGGTRWFWRELYGLIFETTCCC